MTEARHPNGLDALRAFAALSVLGLHLIYVPDWTGFPSTGPLAWFRVGFLGVDIFFVLSGYVIGLSAIRLFPLHGPSRSADFVKRRFARIVPLYWIVSLLFLFAVDSSALTGDNAILQILSHLFFFHNLMPSTAGAINGVTWTLATEMQLYLITALFIRTLVNTRPLVIASVMILLAWGWRASTFVLITALCESPTGAFYSHWATQVPGVLDSYGLGIALAVHRMSAPQGSASRRVSLLMIGGGLAGLAISASVLLPYYGSNAYWTTDYMAICFRTLPALSALLLVIALREINLHRLNPAVWFGRWSYGVYLWHLPLILLLMKVTSSNSTLAFSTLFLTLCLSAISWHFVERPAIEWGRH